MTSANRSTPQHIAWLLPGSTLFFMCGILLGRISSSWQLLLIPLVLSLIAARLSRRWLRSLSMMLLCLCTGALLGWHAWNPTLPPEGEYRVEGVIVQELTVQEDGQVQTCLSGVTLNGEPITDAYWTFYLDEDETLPPELIPGVKINIAAQVYHPKGQQNPGGFDFREYLLQRNIHIGIYGAEELSVSAGHSIQGWAAALRHRLTLRLMDIMGAESGVYAAAMLLGTRDFIARDDRTAFSELGIAHILSISGCHVAVLAGLMLLLLRPLPVRRGVRVMLEALLLGFYCLLTGGSAPVVRASGLLLWRELTRLQHRQPLPLHLLCVTAILQLLFNPTLLTGASFQLTYGAMLGLQLIFPKLKQLRHCRSDWGSRLWNGLTGAVSVQIGILAPQLYWFGELPLLSILLNMFVVSLAGGLISLYWLTLAALPVPGLNGLLGTLADLATKVMLWGVRSLASFEFTSLWTRQADFIVISGCLLLCLGLSTLIPSACRKTRRVLLLTGTCLTLSILLPLPHHSTVYTQLSVGSADAAVLQDRHMTVVIDTGEDGQALASYLHQRRECIETLIITHLHTDHAGGIRALLDVGIPVKRCYLPTAADIPVIDPELLPLLAELADTGTELCTLSRGDTIALPSGQLTVLWPVAERVFPQHDANDTCLVLHADISSTSLLLTGDLSGQYERYVQTPVDILKIAHHGSDSSTSPAFLTATAPQLLLLSNGDEDRDARLRERTGDIPLYDTEAQGAITITFGGDGTFKVKTHVY